MDERAPTISTTIRITPCNASTWEELATKIKDETGWKDDTELFAYTEAVTHCRIQRIKLAQAVPAPDAWEGRLFDEESEARWVQDGAQNGARKLRAWITTEGKGDTKVSRKEEDRRYYLIGEYEAMSRDGATARFSEGRFPEAELEYPVPPGQKLKEHDRAYLMVREYQPVKPNWSALANDPATIEEQLDQPLLCAHRFVGVGVGRDNDVI